LKIFGKTVVYDTHEDFTKRIMIRNWVPFTIRKVVAYAVGISEKLLAKMLDASIATQIDVVSRLGEKAVLIGNVPRFNPELIKDVNALAHKIDDKFDGLRAIYIGGLSYSRGLLDMINAIEIANEIVPIRIWLIGAADQKDLRDARNVDGWKYVDFYERMPQLEAFAYVSKSDVGLIVLRKIGGHECTDPNKIYEYMTFKVPFIASNFDSWFAKFKDIGAGCFVPPGDFEKLSQKLIELAKSPKKRAAMGERGYKYVEKYNWNHEEIKLLNLYDSVVKNKPI
jgi:glycosyltransferase involved in cell wall biosynthesis